MLRTYKWRMLVTSILTLLPIAAGLILWNRLPDKMATHWNAQGVADGFLPKGAAVFFMPLFILAVHWISFFVTGLDRNNRQQNARLMGLILYLCPAVSILCGVLMYGTALGMEISTAVWAQVLVGILFVCIGNYLPKCRYNHTIGIKLSWTLQDEDNWNRTHRTAGPVWVGCGLVIMCTAFLNLFWIMLGVLLIAAIIPTVYSYLYYRKKMEG